MMQTLHAGYLADIFQNLHFRKIPSGIPIECQIVGIQIRPDVLLSLIWVQIVCKGYQLMTVVGRVNRMIHTAKETRLIKTYSKTCVKRQLKNILMTNGSLMKVESIAECLAFCNTFDLH